MLYDFVRSYTAVLFKKLSRFRGYCCNILSRRWRVLGADCRDLLGWVAMFLVVIALSSHYVRAGSLPRQIVSVSCSPLGNEAESLNLLDGVKTSTAHWGDLLCSPCSLQDTAVDSEALRLNHFRNGGMRCASWAMAKSSLLNAASPLYLRYSSSLWPLTFAQLASILVYAAKPF